MNLKLLKTQKAVLFVAGTLLLAVGMFILVSPHAFFAANEIDLGTDVNLLNELKAPAGILVVAGLFIVMAIFNHRLSDTAMWLATLIYLSYATSRLLSMSLDGLPAEGLVQAAALEGVLGLICLAVLVVRRTPTKRVA